ncbi:hypothetical protein CCH79_00011186, partial [Gambusia affinis]
NAKPTIIPNQTQLVVPLNHPLDLRCKSENKTQWWRENRQRPLKTMQIDGMRRVFHLKALSFHSGRYLCRDDKSSEEASIFVFVKAINSILIREGSDAAISCLATDPSMLNLTLETCSGEALPDALQYSTSLEKGIIIHKAKLTYGGCYVCTGMLEGRAVKSEKYSLTVKKGPPEIQMQHPRRIILTRNENLLITCNATNVNGEFTVKWVAPPGSGAIWCPQQPAKVDGDARILTKDYTHARSVTLQIESVRPQDAGSYKCEARNEKGNSTMSVWLDVYERGFISSAEIHNSTFHVRTGDSLSLNVSMEAYPKPHAFSWSFMGKKLRNTSDHVITTRSRNYSYVSELRLVRLKSTEGGIYTFEASNGDAAVKQNFSVFVISKPAIIDHGGPVDGQVRCVAEGYPAPQIKWYYCEKHVRCSQQTNATQEERGVMTIMSESTSFGKRVESWVNVRRRFSTLECVATGDGEQAFILFSISEERHDLFTPLLIGFIAAAGILCLIVILLLYKSCVGESLDSRTQLRPDCSFPLHSDSLNGYMSMRPSVAGNSPSSSSSERRQYQIMSSCWDADPFKRPPFTKVVESIEQQLSDATKHVVPDSPCCLERGRNPVLRAQQLSALSQPAVRALQRSPYWFSMKSSWRGQSFRPSGCKDPPDLFGCLKVPVMFCHKSSKPLLLVRLRPPPPLSPVTSEGCCKKSKRRLSQERASADKRLLSLRSLFLPAQCWEDTWTIAPNLQNSEGTAEAGLRELFPLLDGEGGSSGVVPASLPAVSVVQRSGKCPVCVSKVCLCVRVSQRAPSSFVSLVMLKNLTMLSVDSFIFAGGDIKNLQASLTEAILSFSIFHLPSWTPEQKNTSGHSRQQPPPLIPV